VQSGYVWNGCFSENVRRRTSTDINYTGLAV
jgi:hypothetical protein